MSNDYLWDGSGEPDPEVERLERLLAKFRAPQKSWLPGPEIPMPEHRRRFLFLLPYPRLVAVAAALALVAVGVWSAVRWTRPAWEVARLTGEPRVASKPISDTGKLVVGQVLETDHASRARISVGLIGEVEVEPDSRVRLLEARSTEHRLALDRGKLHAMIWAPPRLFFVNTPSAVAVDLGCRYTLQVDAKGEGLLHVTYGWVAFEHHGRESFVPANAMCVTRPGLGPGTPFFEDASQEFRDALAKFDGLESGVAGGVSGGVAGGISGGVSGGVPGGVEGGVPGGVADVTRQRAAAMGIVLAQARRQDALTLWHLLSRTGGEDRARVYDRLAQLVPPPGGVTRDGVLHGVPEVQRHMRDLWWDVLGLGDTSWWRMWKGPVPVR